MKTYAAVSILVGLLASATAMAQTAPTPSQGKPNEPAAATQKPDVLTRAPGTVEAGAAAEKPKARKKAPKPKPGPNGTDSATTPPATP